MNTKKIDLRGLTCPEPVLKTKRLFDDKTTERVEALVDDDVCVSNLKRLSRSLQARATSRQNGDYFEVVIERGASASTAMQEPEAPRSQSRQEDSQAGTQQAGTVIFLSKDTFGEGDPEFSRTLLNLFLQSVLESGHEPRAILLANTGVRLLAPDSPVRKVLQDFRERGLEVLACGLCVEYYGLTNDVAKEQITNMFAIVEYLFAADKVLSP